MKLHKLSLTRKLTLILTLNAALAVFATAGFLLVRDVLAAYDQAREQLQAITAVVGENSRAALLFGDADNARETLAALRTVDEIATARLYDSQNRLLAEYRALDPHRSQSVFLHRLIDALLPVDLPISREIGDNADDLVGRLDVEAHLTSVWIGQLQALALTLVVAIGMIALTSWIGLRLRAMIADPILALAEVAHRITRERDYRLRAPKVGEDEIGVLTDDFNRMLDEIQLRDKALHTEREVLELRVAERTLILRQTTEAAQEARAAAEAANAAKSEFLSRMSHELRTPLNAIIGFAQMLSLPAKAPLSEQQADNVVEILKAGQHLLGQVNEVLDLARIESGCIEIDLEPVGLAAAVADCLAQVRPLTERRQIAVQTAIDASLAVRGDRMRLKQVILNLLSNAIKYNRDQGCIDVTASLDNGRVRVAVRDTGRGIAPAQMSSLFKPFERLESSYDGIEGTGIGLALVKRLVEAMAGEIGIESAVGVGSTFWFALPADTLPAAPAAEPPLAVAPKVDAGETARRMLYIEDNPANLKLMKKIVGLRPEFVMHEAMNAELGLEIARRERPDLILLDINLPGMGGFAALVHLRGWPETANIPVIAVSANAMARDIERARSAGFDDYLAKPIDLAKLNRILDMLLVEENRS